jgi:hypothetical protein
MIWFFERGGQRLQCEMRPAAEGGGFELAWQTPDGETHIEKSDDTESLTARRRQVEENLKADGWKRLGRETPDKRFL